MPVTSERPAPYTSPTAILGIIDRYRNRGLQSPFTAEVLGRAGVSDSLIPRTLQALQALDLINEDGTPTETLEGLRRIPEAEYQNRLQEWLKGAYEEVFTFVDPSTDSSTAIRDAFRTYEPVGQQSRMVTLFMGLCEAAGLITKTQKETKPRQPRTPSARPSIPTRRRTTAQEKLNQPSHIPQVPPAISGLLGSLPPEGQGWTQERRDKFMETFGTVLDFVFPIGEDNEEGSEGE
jgi:hypothetical protein